MEFTEKYMSPLGEILISCNENALTGLWFEGQKYFAEGLDNVNEERPTPVSERTKEWLDIYFSGREPGFLPPLTSAETEFRQKVRAALLDIPYGKTVTYGEIAAKIGTKSARAVGNAVAHNRISVIVPCHRVFGANGSLTGYAGGIDRKLKLCRLEKISVMRSY